jgi:hypothetical protein
MDLPEACCHIGLHHLLRLGHGFVSGAVTPGIWAKVVAAEHDLIGGAAFLPCDSFNEGREIARFHTSVTAQVVDLIAGCLDQHCRSAFATVPKSSAQHDRMRGAY